MKPEINIDVVSHVETECHETKNLFCERKDMVDIEMYERDMDKYRIELVEYYRKNWFVRLFTEKPQEPCISDYMFYY